MKTGTLARMEEITAEHPWYHQPRHNERVLLRCTQCIPSTAALPLSVHLRRFWHQSKLEGQIFSPRYADILLDSLQIYAAVSKWNLAQRPTLQNLEQDPEFKTL